MKKTKSDQPLFSVLPDGTVTSNHWLLTVKQAATAMGIEPEYLRRKVLPSCKTPFEIQPLRMGKKVRFRLLDIVNYLKKSGDEKGDL